MQVTKELIENDIVQTEAQLEQLKAQAAQVAGALAVLRNIRDYLDKPEEVKAEEAAGPVSAVEEHKVVNGVGKYVKAVEGENSSGS